MVLSHVDIESPRSGNFLELTLWAWRASNIVEAADDLEHRRQCHLAGVTAKTSVRTDTVVDVGIHWPVDADLVRLREELGFTVGTNLGGASVRP